MNKNQKNKFEKAGKRLEEALKRINRFTEPTKFGNMSTEGMWRGTLPNNNYYITKEGFIDVLKKVSTTD